MRQRISCMQSQVQHVHTEEWDNIQQIMWTFSRQLLGEICKEERDNNKNIHETTPNYYPRRMEWPGCEFMGIRRRHIRVERIYVHIRYKGDVRWLCDMKGLWLCLMNSCDISTKKTNMHQSCKGKFVVCIVTALDTILFKSTVFNLYEYI